MTLFSPAAAISWMDFPENIPTRNGSTITDYNPEIAEAIEQLLT